MLKTACYETSDFLDFLPVSNPNTLLKSSGHIAGPAGIPLCTWTIKLQHVLELQVHLLQASITYVKIE